MAKRKKLQDQNPPRRVEIRGQDHLLAYITPEEAKMLMANGGSGEAGPMGIPAFDRGGGGPGGSAGSSGAGGGAGAGAGDGDGADDNDDGGMPGDDTGQGSSSGSYGGGGLNEGQDNTGIADAAGYGSGSPSGGGGGMSPGRSQAQFGTTEFAGLSEQQAQGLIGSGQASQQAMDVQSNLANQRAAEIATLEQLNRDLYDLSRREAKAKAIPGILGQVALNNVRNIAAAMAGYPPGLLEGLNFSSKTIGPGLDPSTLAGLQSRGIRGATGKDPFGRETTGIVGFRDEYGNLSYGRDPDDPTAGGDGYDDRPEVAPVNPATGQCDAGYMFDEDLQACRLDTGGLVGGGVTGDTFVPGAYARMGLLDVAPTGLPEFSEQYGIPSQDFDAANLAFRRGTATQAGIFQDPYDLTGYTLLG